MARPRVHDDRTRAALLDAAEAIVARSGPHALSVRAVADEVGTTTRAVYSVFGSKGGLLAELARRAFEFLRDALDELLVTDDPVGDLVEVGVIAYRRFVLEHPSLYRIAFQRAVPGLELTDDLAAARAEGFGRLERRVERVAAAGALVEDRDVRAAAVEFNAMCEGLANAELRGGTLRVLPAGEEERVWRDAFQTVVRGLTRAPR
ncbi:MAG TPA: TetR/AcrR family transcriptional regulator [Solirubrobacteraceae bacterium]|nr:TetR/AcrR family transcriptional regulator [Solirubrobacteraceae bacterium]